MIIILILRLHQNLKRAQKTLNLILSELNLSLHITKDEALNERDYGSLVSQNKFEAAEKIWKRSGSNMEKKL